MKRIPAFLLLALWGAALYADVSNQVVVVRSNIPDSVVETYNHIAIWLANSGNKELSEKIRSDASERFGSGTLVQAPGGSILILTNYHVVAQSKTVSIEFAGRNGSGEKFTDCSVIAANIDRDLALIELPNETSEIAEPLEFSEEIPHDGDEVWSAGFPGLISSPSWQFAKGTVTNESAFVEELRVPELNYVIQHSALIDPGSSGGPLLVKRDDDEYRIVGVNTWRILGRSNTYFAIPAADASAYVKEFGDVESLKDVSLLENELIAASDQFLSLFTSSQNQDILELKKMISDELVSLIGWDSYLAYRERLDDEKRNELDAEFVTRNAYDAMREAVAARLDYRAGDSGGSFLRIETPINTDSTTVSFEINGKEESVTWARYLNQWIIIETSFFTDSNNVENEAAEEKETETIDRNVDGLSITLRTKGVLPLAVPSDSAISTHSNLGFALGASFDLFFNPFFGALLAAEYQKYSFKASGYGGNDTLSASNIMISASLRAQVPLLIAKENITLIPWVSFGIGIGINFSLKEGLTASDEPLIPLLFPISLGLEMTTDNLKRTIIWGLETSYIIELKDYYHYYSPAGSTIQEKISFSNFGVTVRFPY